jgi:hypothetical protein
MLRPEVLGIAGLCIAAVATFAVALQRPHREAGRPAVCPSCGTFQHNLGRHAALMHEIIGPDDCISCGKPLRRPEAH